MLSSYTFAFSPPQYFWPQKDISPSSINDSSLESKVLIASRDSEYKRALVEKITTAFTDEPVFVKCIGMKMLNRENTSAYKAIIVLNTCLGWDWDRHVHSFLRKKKDGSNVIVITTSATGDWQPKKNKAGVDAMAAASETDDLKKRAVDIIRKVRLLLEKE